MAMKRKLLILLTSLVLSPPCFAGGGFDINNPLEGLPPIESLQGTSDPLEGLPLLGNKQQQCAQLAHHINFLRKRSIYLERRANLAQREMQNYSDKKASFNTNFAIAYAHGEAESCYKESISIDKNIQKLMIQYNKMCCGQ